MRSGMNYDCNFKPGHMNELFMCMLRWTYAWYDYLGVGMSGEMRPIKSLFIKDGYLRVVVDTDLEIYHQM